MIAKKKKKERTVRIKGKSRDNHFALEDVELEVVGDSSGMAFQLL